ncbi:MAG: hypothetical protein ACI8UO_001135 [Verrucomicrobiales bacterium]|jgi:hypothetical protein
MRTIFSEQLLILVFAVLTIGCQPGVPTPNEPTATVAAAPPLGFWQESEHGLYVSVHPIEGDSIQVGELGIQVGGPPPTAGKADAVFIPTSWGLQPNRVSAAGMFNWDPEASVTKIEVKWTANSVKLTVFEDSATTQFPSGTYVLEKAP